jgi:hypothetical protein
MSDDRFYQGSSLGKLFGQAGAGAQLGAVITLISGEVGLAAMLFIGGLISMFIGYQLSGGSNNPYL